jgi:hypothetical protein
MTVDRSRAVPMDGGGDTARDDQREVAPREFGAGPRGRRSRDDGLTRADLGIAAGLAVGFLRDS